MGGRVRVLCGRRVGVATEIALAMSYLHSQKPPILRAHHTPARCSSNPRASSSDVLFQRRAALIAAIGPSAVHMSVALRVWLRMVSWGVDRRCCLPARCPHDNSASASAATRML